MNTSQKRFRFKMKMSLKLTTILVILIGFGFGTTNVFGQKRQKKNKKIEEIDTLNLAISAGAYGLQLTFLKGDAHNHPTFAIWLEDMDGKLIETLFVTQYFAKGIFGHGDAGDGSWKKDEGEAIRPAALPYWSHKRNVISRDSIFVPTPESPVLDAISGATPSGSFVLNTSVENSLPNQFKIMMEVNQTWDWNDYWTNNKYPNDKDYKTSAQPSLVYESVIDLTSSKGAYQFAAIGHGHYSGKDGKLYDDITTLTTALNIFNKATVVVKPQNK